MSKRPVGLVYVGSFISYFLYLPVTFPRGLEINLEGSITFPIVTLLIYIKRLSLFNYLYKWLFNYVTVSQGGWAGTTALCIDFRWCCTIAVSA